MMLATAEVPAALTLEFLAMSAAKFALSDSTPMPPISGSRSVIVPCAAATIASTFAGRPLGWLNATV